MRKSELIKLLSEIKGNPEVVLWNGFVSDYQHVSPNFIEAGLVKQTFEGYLENCRLEKCVEHRNFDFQFEPADVDELKEQYKNVVDWTDNGFVSEEDIKQKRYKKKRVVYIQAELRGVSTFDWSGTVYY
jgi:hypothetical protein